MSEWYVAYINARDVETRLANDRGAAINEACELLRQGIEVMAVGPMAAAAGTTLDADDLMEIFERRGRVGRLPGRLPAAAPQPLRPR